MITSSSINLVILISLCKSTLGADPLTTTLIGSAISAGTSLTGTTVNVLSSTGGSRNIVIEITNHLDTPLIGGNRFLNWGYNKVPPPTLIKPRTMEAAQFCKTGGSAAGTSGLLSYRVDDDKDSATFVIDFSVPFNYIHSSNWFGLAFVDRGTPIDKELFEKFYYDPAWKEPNVDKKFTYATEGKPIYVFYKDYIVSASMSSFGRAVLKVDVQKRAGGFEQNRHRFS